ncbi:hypothetical protein ACOSP7_026354 [Xanthoceras sorbifolium]
MAQQVFLISNSLPCLSLTKSKFSSKLLWSNRVPSSLTSKAVNVNGGRVQACLAGKTSQEISRPLANFPSNIWKDSDAFFASAASRSFEFDQKYGSQIKELEEKVKEMLVAPTDDLVEKVSFINLLCRLGVSYLYEDEIDQQLIHILALQPDLRDTMDYDLYTVSLLFRVFRQYGYKISSGVFDKFKEDDGRFKETLTSDARGMLSLYEATHLRVHGEDILEEALAFSKAHLKSLAEKSSPHMAKQILKALDLPMHKDIPRLETLHFISIYGEEESRNETLLLFAKLDFNRVQLLHQQEIAHCTSWWNDLKSAANFTYARDRMIELYFWINAVFFQPRYSRARIMFNKVMKMSSIIDDTYDAYGTFGELQRFTDAVERWDASAVDELPDYMKVIYSALLNLYDEINKEVSNEGRSYTSSYAKDLMKDMVRAYHLEAEWLNKKYDPTFDEYWSNALKSAGCFSFTAVTFAGMGDIAGPNAFEWLQSRPKTIKGAYTVGRLIDDIKTHEFEQKRDHVASGVECYMKQYGVSREEANEKLMTLCEDAWKDMNEECMKPTPISLQLLIPVVNIARLTEVTYLVKDGANFSSKLLWGNNHIPSFTNKTVNGGRFRACLAAKTNEETSRPLANFHPDIWKDTNAFFASAASRISEFDRIYGSQIKELEEKVTEMLIAPTNDLVDKVSLINSICRLGVSYLFEDEIDQQLNHILAAQPNLINEMDYDLYTVSLLFRVFRQHGYKISCDVFNKFKEDDGRFKETLTSDAKGMLGLYEATHLRLHGEDILEEALAFSKAHLKSLAEKSSPHMAKQILKALDLPMHKDIPRLDAIHYLSIYGEDESSNETLLLFAKLDFNRVQLLHQQEITQVTSWINDLNLTSKLPYARDRILENYFWAVGIYYEPYNARARIMFTHALMIWSRLDDTYDAYGTLEELRLLTAAIERWDTNTLDGLPDYMKILYNVLFNLFEEIGNDLTEEERSYRLPCVIETLKEMVRSYQIQAEWFNQGYVPTFDEYMGNALVATGSTAISASIIVGMGESAGSNAFEWIRTHPKILKATYIVIRLLNDIKSNEFEQKRGHVASSTETYMKQYGVTREKAIEKLNLIVADAWKDINEESMKPTAVPMEVLLPIATNGARVAQVAYKENDGYTDPKYLKNCIAQLFIEPMPI